ncbi:hypothetical protein P4114_06195 [Pseudomonas aeruginosa]|nr:hypothetical protein [Pseudomonas aeruginosa]
MLIDAMQERGGNDILHGVPKILMMDPGSANTSAMARNLAVRCASASSFTSPVPRG